MDQVKIEAAQAKVRTQGARTASSPEKIEQAVAAVASMAALVEGGSQVEHTNTGVLNVTVFDLGAGPKCRITAYTTNGGMVTVQVLLA